MFSQGDADRLSCFVMQDLHRRLWGRKPGAPDLSNLVAQQAPFSR